MKCQRNFFFVNIFLLFSFRVYSADLTYEENTVFRVRTSDYKNQSFQFNYPFSGTKVELNLAGEGFITLPVKKMLFTELILSENKTIPLFIKPGDEISLEIQKDKFFLLERGPIPIII